jgi:hypothetical protein
MATIDVLQNDFSGGMNALSAPNELEPNECVYLQDFIINQQKQLRSRGPVTPISGITNPTGTPEGGNLFVTEDPQGTTRLAYVADANLYVWRGSVIGWVDVANDMGVEPIDASPALGGGLWFGSFGGQKSLTLWRGGGNPNYSTGTITINHTTHFDPTNADYCGVSGGGTAWTNTVTPGMFLFVSGFCIGVVAQVTSDTSLILEAPALYSGNDSTNLTAVGYGLTSIRGFFPVEVTGRITTSSASAVVTGSDTAFTTLSAGYLFFRALDHKYIGAISAVTHDRGLTLAANATTSLQLEEYIAIPGTAEYDQDFVNRKPKQDAPGLVTCTHAYAQWYAYQDSAPNQDGDFRLRVWRSDARGPECVNLKRDFLHIPSTRGKRIYKMLSIGDQLLVFTDRDVYSIVGDTPETFSPVKIMDDGLLSPLKVQKYSAGCVWMGQKDVYYHNGTEITSIGGKLGQYYLPLASSMNLSAGSLVHDNYFVASWDATLDTNCLTVSPGGSVPDKSGAIAIYIPTGAISFLLNVNIQGSVQVPKFVDDNSHTIPDTTLYMVATSTDALRICDARDLLRLQTPSVGDTITCRGMTFQLGPNPYFESQKFDAGTRTQSKVWRKVSYSYAYTNSSGNPLSGAVRPGAARGGTTLTFSSLVPATAGVWSTATRRFDTRDRYCGITLYLSDVGTVAWDIDYIAIEARSLQRPLR